MNRRFKGMLFCAALAAFLAGCASTPNTGSADERQIRHTLCLSTLTQFRERDGSLEPKLDQAYGYAIFPEVVNGAVIVGGAHGNGEVYQQGRLIGYADLSQANIGPQVGGQKYAELILFENERSLRDFEGGTTEFDARGTAVAAASGSAAAADYTKGVIVFSLPESGLMLQAAIGGQRFRYTPVEQSMPRNSYGQ